MTSGEQGGGSDLETRIDQAPAETPASVSSAAALKDLLAKTPLLASLQLQSTQRDSAGVFVRIHSAVVLSAASDWSETGVYSALNELVRPALTAGQLGVFWQQKSGYQQLDGLWPLSVSVRGKDLAVSDDPTLLEAILAKFPGKSDHTPFEYSAGFNHKLEGENFARLTSLVDRPGMPAASLPASERQPQFFSGNMTSLSSTLADVSSERIEIRSQGDKVKQTVTYEWSR